MCSAANLQKKKKEKKQCVFIGVYLFVFLKGLTLHISPRSWKQVKTKENPKHATGAGVLAGSARWLPGCQHGLTDWDVSAQCWQCSLHL